MNDLRKFVEDLARKLFSSSNDDVWKNWVDYKQKNENELIKLLHSDVRDEFKKRALFLLLAPSVEQNVLYWGKEIRSVSLNDDFFVKLHPDLLGCAADLVITFVTKIISMYNREKVFSDDGRRMSFLVKVPGLQLDNLCSYNRYILALIPKVSEEKAEKMFSLFSLLDIYSYSGIDEASGYHPFFDLLNSEIIDEKWKRKANEKMIKIIKNELSGAIKPREEWEDALRQYAELISRQLYDKVHYSLEFFVEQLQFIMDNRAGQSGLIHSWNVIKLFVLLPGEEYRPLRHSIARYVILEDRSGFCKFSIYDENTESAAKLILEQFGDDQELVGAIKVLFEEQKTKQAEQEAYFAEKKAEEDKVLAPMR